MILIAFLLACLSVCFASPSDDLAWQDYKLEFGKVYATEEEETARYETWRQNVKEIDLHNADYTNTYQQGQNEFTDMTDEEFQRDYVGCLRIADVNLTSNAGVFVPSSNVVPKSVDWLAKGYVTEVKDQGKCGSCYAFGATGALEGQWFKKHGKLVSLSEQQIVDCSEPWHNHGCAGGTYGDAWLYILAVGGSQTGKSYPYEDKKDKCRFNKQYVAATVKGYDITNYDDEKALTQGIAEIGPIAVAIDASTRAFRRYKSGVFYDEYCIPWRLNHAVLAVGYGTEDGNDYYLVKNSWGVRFGKGGYIKMARNKKNHCGIASRPAYPLV